MVLSTFLVGWHLWINKRWPRFHLSKHLVCPPSPLTCAWSRLSIQLTGLTSALESQLAPGCQLLVQPHRSTWGKHMGRLPKGLSTTPTLASRKSRILHCRWKTPECMSLYSLSPKVDRSCLALGAKFASKVVGK